MILEDFLRAFAAGLPHGSLWALVIALFAGIVSSVICPCTIPVGLGVAGAAGAAESRNRRDGFKVAALFFLGIVLNLAMLGALAGRLGGFLTESFGTYWAVAMVVISLFAAIAAFRGIGIDTDRLVAMRKPGLLGTLLYGFVFSLGTSVAPLLLLLTVSAAQGRAGYGFLLSAVFGLGRGLPFLFAGIFGGVLMRLMRLGSWRRTLQIASGVALIVVSVYFARVYVSLR
jgi:cytochrome c-type biogenesis protein